MDDLTRVLRDYAFHYWLEGCYDAASREDREESEQMAELNLKELQDACSPAVFERVDVLHDTLEAIRAEDMDAAFTCGLRVGLALR